MKDWRKSELEEVKAPYHKEEPTLTSDHRYRYLPGQGTEHEERHVPRRFSVPDGDENDKYYDKHSRIIFHLFSSMSLSFFTSQVVGRLTSSVSACVVMALISSLLPLSMHRRYRHLRAAHASPQEIPDQLPIEGKINNLLWQALTTTTAVVGNRSVVGNRFPQFKSFWYITLTLFLVSKFAATWMLYLMPKILDCCGCPSRSRAGHSA